MASMKSLAKDTAIYGLSSIVGRFLNYLLVPLYTHVIPASSGGYGIVTNLYAYVALLLVILTFGMETTFFRFANKEDENPHCVFSTSIAVIGSLTAIFLAAIVLFINPLSQALGYVDHKEYILMMACVVALDAIQAIPFSYLRYKKNAIKFAALKMLFILLNIGLNIIYFVFLGKTDVFYVFALNLVCTGLITFFFIPEFAHEHVAARVYCKENNVPFKIVDFNLLCRMFKYSWPILVLGIAGILNQTIDKMLFPIIYAMDHSQKAAEVQLGIYGGSVKIAMIMAMITQAFRYAYEPIVFAKSKDSDKKEYYAQAMKYFLIFTLFAYLCVIGYMPILEQILGADYHEGMKVVPIVMAAEIMMGIYFNLSFWYKLIDKTVWGAWFSAAGCAALIAVNVIFIPQYSYMACAWGGVAGYGTAMVLSYIVGQKKYPINYNVRHLLMYVCVTIVLYYTMDILADVLPVWAQLLCNTVIIAAYLALVITQDMPLSSLPIIGKKFKK
ncbi:MAG: polysaccharide biosynthesis protein [Prevotella sp.]|nr:polysaccharide biosynthesis protein [Candidatus Prevotella equi]